MPCGDGDPLDDPVARVLMRIPLGHMPQDCLDASLSALMSGIKKKGGGVRILGKGTVPRRKVGKAIAKVLKTEIKEAVALAQHEDDRVTIRKEVDGWTGEIQRGLR